MNYDLQRSARLATSELEALKAQVRDLQGSLQSGESENGRLQAELRCLRQSMQACSICMFRVLPSLHHQTWNQGKGNERLSCQMVSQS